MRSTVQADTHSHFRDRLPLLAVACTCTRAVPGSVDTVSSDHVRWRYHVLLAINGLRQATNFFRRAIFSRRVSASPLRRVIEIAPVILAIHRPGEFNFDIQFVNFSKSWLRFLSSMVGACSKMFTSKIVGLVCFVVSATTRRIAHVAQSPHLSLCSRTFSAAEPVLHAVGIVRG